MDRTQTSIILTIVGLLLVVAVAVAQDDSTALTDEQTRLNLESFDIIWQTIHDRHYDTTFSGLDWPAMRDSLRPQVESAETIEDARHVMSHLVNSLGLSHFAVIPGDIYVDIDKSKDVGDEGGVSGLSVRALDGKAVVTEVRPESPALDAGVEVGWEVYIVDGDTIPNILPHIEEKFDNKQRLPIYKAQAVVSRMMGIVGDTVTVTFRDANDESIEIGLVLAEPSGTKAVFGNLPPFYVRSKTDTVGQGVGYFYFNAFFDPNTLMPAYNKAMREFLDMDGIIIDLRGNPGGIAALGMGMAGWLVDEKNLYIGTLSTRETDLKLIINPRANSYDGPVAVLIDGLSGSSSEFFAGGLQDIGRVHVFGTPSMGAALPSVIEVLPNGDRFQYVLGNFVLTGGEQLEKRGVIPDTEVHLTRDALLAGDDPVIDAAVKWIRSQQETTNN